MKIVTKAPTEKECRLKLLSRLKIDVPVDLEKPLYGHYSNRFVHEMHAEYDGANWQVTFEVGKPRCGGLKNAQEAN